MHEEGSESVGEVEQTRAGQVVACKRLDAGDRHVGGVRFGGGEGVLMASGDAVGHGAAGYGGVGCERGGKDGGEGELGGGGGGGSLGGCGGCGGRGGGCLGVGDDGHVESCKVLFEDLTALELRDGGRRKVRFDVLVSDLPEGGGGGGNNLLLC